MKEKNLPMQIPDDLKQIIIETGQENNSKLVQYILNNTDLTIKQDIASLWEQPDFAGSFWIYLMNSIEFKKENEIAKQLLFWKAISVKEQARVICYQSSNDEFSYCSSALNVHKYPVLLLGTSPDFSKAITIPSDILFELIKEDGQFQTFLNGIHSSIVYGGKTLEEINKELINDKIIKGFKTIYEELKSLIKITVKTDI